MDEIRIVRGAPSEEELAALVSVLLAPGSAPEATSEMAPVSRWARAARPPAVVPGPDAWRASALPR